MNNEIWFIHGANASKMSFNYLKDRLGNTLDMSKWSFTDVTYDCNDNLADTIGVLGTKLPQETNLTIIGHSLGGVIAVGLSQLVKRKSLPSNVRSIITLGSPLAGSESADYLRFLYPSYPLFKNITTKNSLIKSIQSTGAVLPTLCFVTTAGNNPLYPVANDGVVTVNSQRSLKGSKCLEVPFNHFEVLLSNDVADHVRSFITHISSTEV